LQSEQVQEAIKTWFENLGFRAVTDVAVNQQTISVAADQDETRWLVIAIGEEETADRYLRNFDGAVAQLIGVNEALPVPIRWAIGLAYGRTERGEEPSYRKILKKYSNSVIFADLDVHLLLVREDGSVEDISPEKVNHFLRYINEIIAGHTPNVTEDPDQPATDR